MPGAAPATGGIGPERMTGGSMIGTNRELKSIQRSLDRQIIELSRLARAAPHKSSASDRLTELGRQRIRISAVLANRRIEAAKRVVELSRWLTGNGALFKVD